MAVKVFQIKSSTLTSDYDLRNDYKYHLFADLFDWNLFDVKNKCFWQVENTASGN